jgi:hypothetical protein
LAEITNDGRKLREDLDYARRAVERQRVLKEWILPTGFLAVLGAYILARCLAADFSPAAVEFFKRNPAGMFLIPVWLYYVWCRKKRREQTCAGYDRRDILRFLAPLLVLVSAGLLVWSIAVATGIPRPAAGYFVLVLLAVTLVQTGLSGVPSLVYVGLALGLGILAPLYLPRYGWSTLGALVFVALVGGSLLEKRVHARG